MTFLHQTLSFLTNIMEVSNQRGSQTNELMAFAVEAFQENLTEETSQAVEKEVTRIVGSLGVITGLLEGPVSATKQACLVKMMIMGSDSVDETKLNESGEAMIETAKAIGDRFAEVFEAGRQSALD